MKLVKRVYALLVVFMVLIHSSFISFAGELGYDNTDIIENESESDEADGKPNHDNSASDDKLEVAEETDTTLEKQEESNAQEVEEEHNEIDSDTDLQDEGDAPQNTERDSLIILNQPTDAIGYVGETVSFTVEAQGDGLEYCWYLSSDGGNNWKKCTYYWDNDQDGNKIKSNFVGQGTNTLDICYSKLWMQKLFKCVVSDDYGNSLETDVVQINPGKAVVVNQSEVEIEFKVGDSKELFVEAKGIDLQYRWYESKDSGNTWVKSFENGWDSSRLLLNNLDSKYDNRQYYCQVRDRWGEQCNSSAIILKNKKNNSFVILNQPTDAIGYVGETVSFTVEAQGDSLEYCWYLSSDGGNNWKKCTYYWDNDQDGNKIKSNFVGQGTNTLDIFFSKLWMQKQFKCVVSDGDGDSIETDVVQINPGKAVVFNQSETEIEFKAGDSKELFVEAKGIDLQYRWYESKDSGKTWTKTFEKGFSSCRLVLNNLDSKYDNRQYYCLVKDKFGNLVETREVSLKYEEDSNFLIYNERQVLEYDREVVLSYSELVDAALFSENTATFSIDKKDVSDKDVFLFAFSARSDSGYAPLHFSVNGNQGGYSANYPLQIYEEDYIIPIVGLSQIDTISIAVDSAISVEMGNFELCCLGQVDIAEYQTGIFAVDKPSTALDIDSGIGFVSTDSAVNGNHLFTVCQGVLIVYDISDQYNPKVISCLSGLGETRDIAIANGGDTLVIACRSNGVNLVDVSDILEPKLIRNIETMGMATSVAIGGNYCFVTVRRHGLVIYDISQLEAPVFCAQIDQNQEEVYGCCVSDGHLFMSSWAEQRIHIYSLESIYNPVEVADIHTDGNAAGLTVENGKLYVATGYNSSGVRKTKYDMNYGMGNGLEIYDVSDPSDPSLLSVSKIDGRYFISGFDHWRVVVSNNIAYVTNAYNGVYVYDVSNASAPDRIEKITINIPKTSKKYSVIRNDKYLFTYDQEMFSQSIVTSVTPISGKIFITTSTGDVLKTFEDSRNKMSRNGLYLVDREYAVAESKHEYSFSGERGVSKQYNIDIPGYDVIVFPSHGSARSVVCFGNRIFVAEGVSGVYMYNPENGESEKIAGIETAIGMAVTDDYLYISVAGKGIKVYQWIDDELKNVSNFVTQSGDSIYNLHLSPNKNYIIGQKGLYEYVILDIANKETISMNSLVRTGGMYCNSITTNPTSNSIFGIVNRNSLIFYKNNDAGEPEIVNTLSNSRYLEDAGITGFKDYILQMDYKGYIYYDPAKVTGNTLAANRVVLSGYSVRGIPTVIGNKLFVSDNVGHKITIVDISNISKPKVIQQISVEGNPCEIYEENGTIFVPLGHKGVMVLEPTY